MYMFSGMRNSTNHVSSSTNVALTFKFQKMLKLLIFRSFSGFKVKTVFLVFERCLVEFAMPENMDLDTKIVEIGQS